MMVKAAITIEESGSFLCMLCERPSSSDDDNVGLWDNDSVYLHTDSGGTCPHVWVTGTKSEWQGGSHSAGYVYNLCSLDCPKLLKATSGWIPCSPMKCSD